MIFLHTIRPYWDLKLLKFILHLVGFPDPIWQMWLCWKFFDFNSQAWIEWRVIIGFLIWGSKIWTFYQSLSCFWIHELSGGWSWILDLGGSKIWIGWQDILNSWFGGFKNLNFINWLAALDQSDRFVIFKLLFWRWIVEESGKRCDGGRPNIGARFEGSSLVGSVHFLGYS